MPKKIKLSKGEQVVLRRIVKEKALAPTQIFTQTSTDFLADSIKEILSNLQNSALIKPTSKYFGSEENPFYEPTDVAEEVIKKLPKIAAADIDIDIET